MTTRTQVLLWAGQRISAAVLALCVLVHLITMIYAVNNGLSAAEVLGRTRGNYGWFAFYALFVTAIAVHAPIGLRTALSEMLNWRGAVPDRLVLIAGITLALWGWRAVWGVFV